MVASSSCRRVAAVAVLGIEAHLPSWAHLALPRAPLTASGGAHQLAGVAYLGSDKYAHYLVTRSTVRCSRAAALCPKLFFWLSCFPAGHYLCTPAWPAAAARRACRSGFPDASIGISGTRTRLRGAAKPGSRSRAWARRRASSGGAAGSSGTMTAVTSSPHSESGTPMITTSATPSRVPSTDSTSPGTTFSPPVLITSSARPRTVRRGDRRHRVEVAGPAHAA